VTVIVSTSTPAVLAAQTATTTIPIVFFVAADPVQLGLVTSLSQPGGNLTGVVTLNVEVAAKRLELLHELVPTATIVALLVNPASTALAETITRELEAAARTLGLELHVLHASSEGEIDAAFATLVQLRAGALVIGADALFNSRSEQLAALTIRHRVPRSTSFASLYPLAASWLTEAPFWIRTTRSASTQAEFSKARSPPNCRSSRRPKSSSSST